jgi:hypothetical protein
MIDVDTRLRVGRSIAESSGGGSGEDLPRAPAKSWAFGETPPIINDGWGRIREAMVQVCGKVPEYKGRGWPPGKKRPLGGWKCLKVIKERDEKKRDEKDHVTGTKKKAVFGEEESLLDIFEEHTAYAERTHLTMRQMNSRLIRKGLGFSEEPSMYRAAAAWEDALYNLTRTHESLRVDLTGPLNGQPGRR